MPPAPARRQPEPPAVAWFRQESAQRLVQDVQRQATPELTRVFGHTGLYLRPCAELPPVLSGNLLAQVLSLRREARGFGGDLVCDDASLALASHSLSLVYVLFVLETSPDPAALLAEIARVLKPEGVALLLTLNPWGLARLRWGFRGLRRVDPVWLARGVREAGLEVQRQRFLGPVWTARDAVDLRPRPRGGLGAGLRAAHLLVARRREAGVTPLRAGVPALKLRPGMSAG